MNILPRCFLGENTQLMDLLSFTTDRRWRKVCVSNLNNTKTLCTCKDRLKHCACTHFSDHVVMPSYLRVTDIWCVPSRHMSVLSGVERACPCLCDTLCKPLRGLRNHIGRDCCRHSSWQVVCGFYYCSFRKIHTYTYSPIISVGRECRCGIHSSCSEWIGCKEL